MIGIDLFSGAGGMSLGAERAGIEVGVAVEMDPDAFATYSRNHPDRLAVRCDVRGLSDLSLPMRRDRGTVVFGGPPCQGFSTSNQRTRTRDNETNWLFRSFVGIVGRLRPEWVVFENVRGILETEGSFFVEEVERSFRELGYSVTRGLLDAADFGVPQHRTRFFLVGRLGDVAPVLPTPDGRARVTVAEAFEDLPDLSNGASVTTLPYPRDATSDYARSMRGDLRRCANHLVTRNAAYVVDRYPHIPQGGNWADIPHDLMVNYEDRSRCHTGIYRRLRADRPSVVIGNFRKTMLIHPREHRGLSVREAARLQSFPDSFEFTGSIGKQQQQVGNAVPPLLAEAVFRAVVEAARVAPIRIGGGRMAA